MGRPKGSFTTVESYLLLNCKEGDSFYTDKQDKEMTACAVFHQRKIITERLITITTGGKEPIAKYIVKVTLL